MESTMKSREKYTKIISKLNRLTKEGRVDWEKCTPSDAPRIGGNADWVDFFKTRYADTNLGIGESRFESYSEEFDKMYWTERAVWVLLDDMGSLEYELPTLEGLWNLLESIRYSLADVDSTIDRLLSALDEDEE
jgi:hypothetical protein